MINKLLETAVSRHYLTLLATVLLTVAAAIGAMNLEFKADYRVFFAKDNPQRMDFDRLQNTFGKSDNIFYLIAPRDGTVFTRETLSAVAELTERAWQTPYSTRVDSLTNYQHTEADGDDLLVNDLVENTGRLTDADLARLREIAVNEPLLKQRLISPEGHVTAVNVVIQMPGENAMAEEHEVVGYARALRDEIEAKYPTLEIYMLGEVMLNAAFNESFTQDTMTLVPLMLVIILALIWWFLRSLSGTLSILAVVLVTVVATMGVTGWLGIFLTSPSSTAPTIIMTLAIADCIHIQAGMLQRLWAGDSKRAALLASLKHNFRPILITSVTTIIGFLSMNFSDSPPFRDLGNIVAIGVGLAFIFSITLFPALLMILPQRPVAPRQPSGRWAAFAGFLERRNTTVIVAAAVIMAALISLLPRNELNDDWVNYFDTSVPFRQAVDFSEANLSGTATFEYVFTSKAEGGIADPNFLADIDAFAEWMRSQPEARHVYTVTDIFKRLNKNLNGDDPAFYRLPEQRDLAAQYLLLYEMSLPYGLDLGNQISIDKRSTRVVVVFRNLTSTETLALEKRATAWLTANTPEVEFYASSPYLIFAHLSQTNIRGMLLGTVLAMVLISGVLAISLRSFKFGLVSLLPNLLPASMAFGLWALWNGEIDLGLSVVASMTLGIVVDNSVHLLTGYMRARRSGLAPTAALTDSYTHAGRALLVTTAILVAGFLVLTLSKFSVNANMGLLTATTLAIAIAVAMVFLCALILRFAKRDTIAAAQTQAQLSTDRV